MNCSNCSKEISDKKRMGQCNKCMYKLCANCDNNYNLIKWADVLDKDVPVCETCYSRILSEIDRKISMT